MAKKYYTQIEMYAPITAKEHVVTKEYVDLAIAGKIKNPVRVASTALFDADYDSATKTLTAKANGAIASIDGITLIENDRILLKNQSDATQNGIYVLIDSGDSSNPYVLIRAEDFNTSQDLSHNLIVPVMEGGQGDARFQLTSDGTLILDTTPLIFAKYYGSAGVNKAQGIISGNDVDMNFVITHNLNTKDVKVTLYEGDDEVFADVETTSENTATVSFAVAPATGDSFRVVVMG